MGLPVELSGIALLGLVDRCVEPIGGEIPGIYQQFPAPLDSFFLEIVAEGPVAEHLEESVVVGVEADVLQVVVLAARPDAFLGVRYPGEGSLLVP